RRLGKGSFGVVVEAYDKDQDKMVAIKIIKSSPSFTLQAQTEKAILYYLNERDTGGSSNIVCLLSDFKYRNHECLVFENLSMNLYDLLRNTKHKGVSLNLIAKFGKQILKSLEFLSRPDI